MNPTVLKTMRGGDVIKLARDLLRGGADRLRQRMDANVAADLITEWSPEAVESYAAMMAAADAYEAVLQGGASKQAVAIADVTRSVLIMEMTLRQSIPEATPADAN